MTYDKQSRVTVRKEQRKTRNQYDGDFHISTGHAFLQNNQFSFEVNSVLSRQVMGFRQTSLWFLLC